MKKKPYISVIITYFNKRRFIKKTLDSIFFQSFKNYELIFVYDDSNYEDLKYIKPYLKAFKNTKIIINKKNLGVARSRNKALAKCKGNYIAFIDSDDTWKKTKLMKQLKFMKKKSSNFSFTSYNVIDEQNKFIKKRIVTMDPTYEKLQKKNIIGLSTVMINRIIIKDINFPNLKTQEDFALWLSLIKKGHKLSHINDSLSSWRKCNDSLSSNNLQKIIDAFKLYYIHQNKNLLLSIYSVIVLGYNKLFK
tara:strand:- start:491 stop:1237 length:747 start_codon:yes stop_codon:yes gene_type:complete